MKMLKPEKTRLEATRCKKNKKKQKQKRNRSKDGEEKEIHVHNEKSVNNYRPIIRKSRSDMIGLCK